MTIVQRNLDLTGKVAWVTGGKRAGQVTAKALAEQGADLVLSYRGSKDEARETAAEADALGVRTLVVQADVSNKESVERAVTEALKMFSEFHILVNMASVFHNVKLESITQDLWMDNVNAHIFGTFWPSQVLSQYMPSGSHIINITDRTSVGHVYSGYLPYVVTKAAVASMTRALAVELGPKGIFVNSIAPGPLVRPPHISPEEWKDIRDHSGVKFNVTDEMAMEQLALQVVQLASTTMTSSAEIPLDQGQNIRRE